MHHDEYIKNQKVFFLYAVTITCILIGLFLHYGKLMFVSNSFSHILSYLFILSSYFLLLGIAKRLKKKGIHGVTATAWSSLILFLSGESRKTLNGIWWNILYTITTVFFVFVLIHGIIRFVISLIVVIKTTTPSEEKTIDSIDTAVAVITSLAAIFISIIEIY